MQENEFLEFKRTTGELNEAMVSISSILNKHGHGKIYFGMKNDGTPYPFTIKDSTIRDVSRKIYESIKPQIFPTITKEEILGVEVIAVEFNGQEVPYSAFGKYYIRVADEDRELSPSQLRQIMIGREYEEHWENKATSETIRDIDEQSLQKFYEDAVECGRLPDIGRNSTDILAKLGLINSEHLNNAGRYLFSKNKPIVLKMAIFATDEKLTFLDINRTEGNIFELIDRAVGYIVKNIRWSAGLGEDGIHRIETPEVPVAAVREVVVNSFAHARYDISLQHEIDIFPNRIVITNPGCFANEYTPDDFAARDMHSYLRNEVIARTLYLCKNVETFGSGIKKIYKLCEEQGVSVFYNNAPESFSFGFYRVDINNMPKNGMINDTINDDEIKVIATLKESPRTTISQLCPILGKSLRTVNRVISGLRDKGLLERVGSNKTGYWRCMC